MLRPYTGRQRLVRRTQHAGDFVVNEFRNLLAWTDCLDLERADGPFAR
jgi:hypothetical protein